MHPVHPANLAANTSNMAYEVASITGDMKSTQHWITGMENLGELVHIWSLCFVFS